MLLQQRIAAKECNVMYSNMIACASLKTRVIECLALAGLTRKPMPSCALIRIEDACMRIHLDGATLIAAVG
jgi:hypothetical protein